MSLEYKLHHEKIDCDGVDFGGCPYVDALCLYRKNGRCLNDRRQLLKGVNVWSRYEQLELPLTQKTVDYLINLMD